MKWLVSTSKPRITPFTPSLTSAQSWPATRFLREVLTTEVGWKLILYGNLAGFAFATYPLHRISASADPRNAASCRVLEKAGFTREAHFRQSEWFKGAWADDVVYARLRSDRDEGTT